MGLNRASSWMLSGNIVDNHSPPPHVHSESQQQTAAACDSSSVAREGFHHRPSGFQYLSAPASIKCHQKIKGFMIIDASGGIKSDLCAQWKFRTKAAVLWYADLKNMFLSKEQVGHEGENRRKNEGVGIFCAHSQQQPRHQRREGTKWKDSLVENFNLHTTRCCFWTTFQSPWWPNRGPGEGAWGCEEWCGVRVRGAGDDRGNGSREETSGGRRGDGRRGDEGSQGSVTAWC